MSDDSKIELIVTECIYLSARDALFTDDGCENFGVLFCSMSTGDGIRRLLTREWWPAPKDAYRERLSYHLEIAPEFFNSIVSHAVGTGLSPVIVHSHPGAETARYSISDDFGERRLLPVLSQLVPAATVASALFTPTEIRGRHLVDGDFAPIRRVTVLGRRISVFSTTRKHSPPRRRLHRGVNYDRQQRAFSRPGQELLQSLRVAVVGGGGTGSAVLEQLVRLGVRDIVIVDPDRLEETNVPRVWGSRPIDAQRRIAKVEVQTRHLRSIASGTEIRAIQDNVVRQGVLDQLRGRDLLFGCTDNHWSRAVLNRFAHQHLIPLVDLGIRLDARAGEVVAAAGQVTVVGAGYSCLRCSHLISSDQVRLESMPADERRVLAAEGYVQGTGDPAPSVISLNTTVAGIAVTTAVSLFVNLTGGFAQAALRYDATNGQTFVVSNQHDPSCDVCSERVGVIALGDSQRVSAYD